MVMGSTELTKPPTSIPIGELTELFLIVVPGIKYPNIPVNCGLLLKLVKIVLFAI